MSEARAFVRDLAAENAACREMNRRVCEAYRAHRARTDRRA